MNRTKPQHNAHSQDELNEQINDKLSQLWTGMRDKKKQLLRNLTPGYSRRSQRTLSQLNATHTQTNLTNHHSVTDNQLMRIKQKLASQQSGRKLKQTQIQRLKSTIAQLTNDKKILIKQIQNMTNNNSVSLLSNLNEKKLCQEVDGRTANFNGKEKRKKGSEVFQSRRERSCGMGDKVQGNSNKENSSSYANITNNNSNYNHKTKTKLADTTSCLEPETEFNTFQDLPKSRLIQLLKSTSQYRQFAFYYDSHQLSYLKRLQQQHKKNCHTNYSAIEKQYWVPSQLYQHMKQQNLKNKWGLSQGQLQEVMSEVKQWYEEREEGKMKQMREGFIKKIQKLKRQKENKMPYDLVRLSNARQRQICQNKKRAKSITSHKK